MFRSLVCFIAFTLNLVAHDIITTKLTFSRDIYRIFANRCLNCHGPGSAIPLTSYQEVRPWAVSIKEQVLSRAMPPWGAVKGFSVLMPDGALTQEEVMIIAAWVVGGAPQGNPALLPKKVTMSKGSAALPVKAEIAVETQTKLRRPLQLAGIRPLSETPVESARITAHLPNGRIEPLLWLYHFDPKWERTYTFHSPMNLPIGTLIESTAPLRFILEVLGG